MASDTADNSAFTAATSGRTEAPAMAIEHFFAIQAFQGTIRIGEIVNLVSRAHVVDRSINGITAYDDFFDFSNDAHFRCPFLEPRIFKNTMIDVLGKTPGKPGDEPKQEHRQHDAVKGKEEICGKPQNIGNIIGKYFSPGHFVFPFE